MALGALMARRRRHPVVTLLTDFGLMDGYVAAMKGVVLDRAPGTTVVDLSHAIRPFDIHAAAYLLASAAFEFPAGTVHVAVVDPSVGGLRRILIAESDDQRFVVPDNGLLDICRLRHHMWRWFEVTQWALARRPVAATFHGRDVFAPVAASLVCGMAPAHFGRRLRDVPRRLGVNPAAQHGRQLRGQVLHVDHFGTLITTVDCGALRRVTRTGRVRVRIGRRVVTRLVRTYAEAPRGTLVAVAGSAGWLEISMVEGSAERVLRARRGDPVIVEAT